MVRVITLSPSYALFANIIHGYAILDGGQEDADRFYCGRFGGGNGGLAATKLALFPFLQEVLT